MRFFIILLPFTFFIFGYIIVPYFIDTRIATIPQLAGKPLNQAMLLLSQEKLIPRIIAEKEDDSFLPGTIISQEPSSGKKIKINQPVFLVISKEADRHQMPLVIGKYEDAIKQELQNTDLAARFYYLESNYPTGMCFAQIPSAGMMLSTKSAEIYITGKSEKKYIWPNFKNKRVEEVVALLEEQGINTIQINHLSLIKPNHSCAHCIIRDQQPLVGTILPLSKVHVVFNVK